MFRARPTAEALVGWVTGRGLASPATLLLARHAAVGSLRLIARTTPCPPPNGATSRSDCIRPTPNHPWHGRRFSASWGICGELEYLPVRPDLVTEVQADTAIDEAGYRHPVRFLRLRDAAGSPATHTAGWRWCYAQRRAGRASRRVRGRRGQAGGQALPAESRGDAEYGLRRGK